MSNAANPNMKKMKKMKNEIIGHAPGNCPLNQNNSNDKTDIKLLFCCNCNKAGHLANYRKCEKYIELLERKQQQQNNILQMQNEKHIVFNNIVQKGISYANIVSSNRPENTSITRSRSRSRSVKRPPIINKQNLTTPGKSSLHRNRNISNSRTRTINNKSEQTNFDFLNSQCDNYFGDSLFNIMKNINKFIPSFKKMNKEEKPMKLLEFLLQISPTHDQ